MPGSTIWPTHRYCSLQAASPRVSSASASASSTAPARMSSASLAKALVALAAVAAVAELAAAKTHTIQWSLGANYGDWSNSNAVNVGDTVVFTYSSPHTVDELSQADYTACSFGSPVSTDQSGSTSVTFDKAGTRYFACAAAGGSHCSQGQKVAITVGASSSSPAGQSPPATPSGNSAAASMVPGAGELAMKLALGLGVGGALLAAF
ncbi:hypothetical protein U9M48_033932 [Paspalum notatum var. saurae]|uniref:Phytocyanin domain-containing protein n=1 Tax=Paspalum notatum var. saurae TaxID=547442 RepID=A0AAQ3U9Q4_PASNO